MNGVPCVLRGSGCGATPHRAILATIEWHGGEAEPDGGRHGSIPDEGQRHMPARFWGEAVTTAVFILNRAPTKALTGKTPFEA